MVIYIYSIKYTVLRDIPLICIFFTVQATNPQTSRSSQIHISLHISIHRLPTKLPSFLYSEHYLSFSYFSVISCCPRFFSFLHQHVAQHNPTLLSNKMASTHWNINCLQNSTTPVRLARVIRACDITCSIFIRTMRSGEQLQLLWLNNFPINANCLTGVTAVLFLCPT